MSATKMLATAWAALVGWAVGWSIGFSAVVILALLGGWL
jgi:hypothetical protein